jgi:hypothetical protein
LNMNFQNETLADNEATIVKQWIVPPSTW